jgi:dTDP-glucose 4,6-dehydratase
MKVLIYGSDGWIGQQFIRLLADRHIEYVKGTSRADQTDSLADEINRINPTNVISFIGRTHGKIGDTVYPTIDYLEQKGKLLDNVRDNLYSPLLLAIICQRKGIHYAYLGTGCIFEYDDAHPFGKEDDGFGFTEESLPNFFGSSYSVVKGFTDRLMHQYDRTVLNLRIRMPITSENNSRNFITKITTYKKICSIPNSMTVLSDLLPCVVDMLDKKITGTFNLTNPGLISHNEILEMYKEIVDPSFEWQNFTIEEQSMILSAARSNNYLDTTKLQTMYPHIKPIKEAVRNCLADYPKPIRKTPPSNLWNNRMVLLVTGGCGFIGSNFINHIATKYPDVRLINFDALYYCADVNNIMESVRNSEKYTLVHGNLCDGSLALDTLRKYKCTHVIHFAAQSHVQNSFEESLNYTKDNILGTHILLEACRHYGQEGGEIKKIIHVSTDEVYGESMLSSDEACKIEQSVLCPTNPYAATKAGAELIAQSYNHSYKLPIIITRGNNVYGINQYPEKLIPRFIKLLKENQKVTIQGDGSQLRSFLHIDDTVSAFEKIMESGMVGEIYNIGTNVEYTVMEIARILIELIKHTKKYDDWIEYIVDRPFNDKRYLISNDKLKKLGWEIRTDFNDGIKKLVEYEISRSNL